MTKRQHLFLPAVFSALSFLGLMLCTLLTDPLNNIAYIAIFFILLFIFFISIGHLIVNLRSGQVSTRGKYRIFVLSTLATYSYCFWLAFLRSTQSILELPTKRLGAKSLQSII
jgi:hypothetical protein